MVKAAFGNQVNRHLHSLRRGYSVICIGTMSQSPAFKKLLKADRQITVSY